MIFVDVKNNLPTTQLSFREVIYSDLLAKFAFRNNLTTHRDRDLLATLDGEARGRPT